MYKSVKGVVLREVRYKEADKILTLYTDKEGKITASAHGAYSKRSMLASATQVLTCSDFELDYRNGRYTVKEAQIIEAFNNVKKDIADFSLGCYFAECIESFSMEDVQDERLLRLLLNSLFALDNSLYPQKQIKAAFELKLASFIGYEPDLNACNVCGKISPEDIIFCAAGGNICCSSCYKPDMGERALISADVLEAMRFIIKSGLKRFISFSLTEEKLNELFRVSESYLKYHSDRRINTLDYWKSLL